MQSESLVTTGRDFITRRRCRFGDGYRIGSRKRFLQSLLEGVLQPLPSLLFPIDLAARPLHASLRHDVAPFYVNWGSQSARCQTPRSSERSSIATSDRAPKGQPVSVAGYPRIDTALSPKAANQGIRGPRAGAHDRRSAMGEDNPPNMRLCTPVELMDDRGMADERTPLSPHHRPHYGCAIADIEIDPAKRTSCVWQLGNIWQIEETALL